MSDLKAAFMAANQTMNRSLRFGLLPIALALVGSLRGADQAAPAPSPDELASLRSDNKQLSDELASAWKESEKLKTDLAAAQAALGKSAGQVTDLQQQLATAQAQPSGILARLVDGTGVGDSRVFHACPGAGTSATRGFSRRPMPSISTATRSPTRASGRFSGRPTSSTCLNTSAKLPAEPTALST